MSGAMKVIGQSEKLMVPEKPDGLEKLKKIGMSNPELLCLVVQ